jgi:hypothetical protein
MKIIGLSLKPNSTPIFNMILKYRKTVNFSSAYRIIQNNILINPTKTTCMLIGTAQRIATVTNEPNINLENQFIKNVNTQKLLGIDIRFYHKS